MVLVHVGWGLSFVLCMIRNLKIMCSKAVKCLQKLKGSRGAEVSFLKEENGRDGALTTWMNEPTVTYSSGTVDHLCFVWPMPGTCLPVELSVCVCVVHHWWSRWVWSEAHSSSMSLIVSCWASPSCLTRVEEHVEAWFLNSQLWPTHQDLIYNSMSFFFLHKWRRASKKHFWNILNACLPAFILIWISFIMQLLWNMHRPVSVQ